MESVDSCFRLLFISTSLNILFQHTSSNQVTRSRCVLRMVKTRKIIKRKLKVADKAVSARASRKTLSAPSHIRDLEESRIPQVKPFKLESCPALVLNSDYQPLSYFPLSLWPWQDVMKAVFLERVEILATYDIHVRSANEVFPLPSVVCLKKFQKSVNQAPAFSRFNVFLRDNFHCQYCNQLESASDLTFDHIIPKSRGGKSCWTNIVTACMSCNNKKGSKLLQEMKGSLSLIRKPKCPSYYELQDIAKRYPPAYLHESWLDFVYWDNPLLIDESESESEQQSNLALP
uniref:HNH nuclease domain-containing protein n=1 Tax=Timspurckia oligopyrenoides TaxID=708627 RepID=A0A7S0ZJU0_9RHOD